MDCGKTFFLKNVKHSCSRLEDKVGISNTAEASLYDNDGSIIFMALN